MEMEVGRQIFVPYVDRRYSEYQYESGSRRIVLIQKRKSGAAHRPHRFNYKTIILFPDYDAFGDVEGLSEGEGDAAFSREALMALNSTMEVYLLSSEYVIFSSD